MTTAKEIVKKYTIEHRVSEGRVEGEVKVTEKCLTDDVIAMMNEWAIEVLRDYDNWKAHKTPQLVELYIKEKGL